MKSYRIHKDVVCLQQNEMAKPVQKQNKKKRNNKKDEVQKVQAVEEV